MKSGGLVKKLFAPIAVSAGLLLSPFAVSADEPKANTNTGAESSSNLSSYYGGELGICFPSEESIKDIYGSRVQLRVFHSQYFNKHARIKDAISFMGELGNPYEFSSGDVDNLSSSSFLSVLSLETSVEASFLRVGDFSLLFNLGTSLSYVNETLSFSGRVDGESFSESAGGGQVCFGAIVGIGGEWVLNENVTFYSQLVFSPVGAKNYSGDFVDVGGSCLNFGVRFKGKLSELF